MLTVLFCSGYSNSERCWCKQPNCPSGEGSLFSAHVWTQYGVSGCPCNDSATRIHEILQRWYLHHVIQSCVCQRRCKWGRHRIPYSYFCQEILHIHVQEQMYYIFEIFKDTVFIKITSRCFYKGN